MMPNKAGASLPKRSKKAMSETIYLTAEAKKCAAEEGILYADYDETEISEAMLEKTLHEIAKQLIRQNGENAVGVKLHLIGFNLILKYHGEADF